MAEVTLAVNGVSYAGWKDVQIRTGIEQISGSFRLAVTERWPGQPELRPLRPDDACVVAIDGQPVITGYIDDVERQASSSDHAVTISGRDRSGQLVDCSAIHEPGEFKGRTALQIAQELAQPWGIAVRAATDVGRPFETFTVQKGETAFDALKRLARIRGLLVYSDGLGGVVFARSGTAHCGVLLREGPEGNIKSGTATFSHAERFSQYRVMGQSGAGWSDAEASAEQAASAKDGAVRLFRPLIILAEDQADGLSYTDRARWEARTRAAKAKRLQVTVQGWKHTGGLWQPNQLVQVDAPMLGWTGDLLISAVELKLSGDEGSTAQLDLVGPGAFDLLPMPEDPA